MAFSSIDVDGMGRLVDRLTRVADDLHMTATDLRAQASRESVSTSATWRIGGVASWIEAELPMLRRRLELARVADAKRPVGLRGASVRLDEPVVSAAEARARGRELAERLAGVTADADGAQQLHDLAQDLAEWADDPDAMSAFWAEAGSFWAENLPYFLQQTGSSTAAADFEVFSRAFTTALHDVDPPAGFTEITDLFRSPPPDSGEAWARLALLQHGSAPTDFLVDVAEANALVFLREQTNSWDLRGNSSFAHALGLPEDSAALAFLALAQDPVAVRRAIPAGTRGDMVDLVFGYARSFGTGDEVAGAFGKAIEAGAGVHDEAMGEHSSAAARFAFEVFVASAGHDRAPWMLLDSLDALAASYAPELLGGANLRDMRGHESSLAKPDGWIAYVGLDPHFFLSIDDTHAFLRLIAADDASSARFDQTAQELYERLLGQAAAFDAEHGPNELGRTAQLFGALAAVQYLAQLDVRGNMDASDQAVRDALAKGFNFVLGKVPTPAGQVAGWGWRALKWGVAQGVDEWRRGEDEDTRVAVLHNARMQAAFLRDYQVFAAVAVAVPEIADGLPPELRAPDGGLVDAETLIEAPDMFEAFQSWIGSTDADFTAGTPDNIVNNTSNALRGGTLDVFEYFGVTMAFAGK